MLIIPIFLNNEENKVSARLITCPNSACNCNRSWNQHTVSHSACLPA